MKYAIGALLASVAIVFSFQNCKKNTSVEGSVESNSVSKVDLAQEIPSATVFYFEELQTMQKTSGSYQVISRTSVKVDLVSGEIERTAESSAVSQKFCLTEPKLAELKSLLAGFQVCKVQHQVDPGAVCTMIYKFPYASIITSREQFELGLAESGCPRETIDLCDSQKEVFLAFAESIKGSYQQMACSN